MTPFARATGNDAAASAQDLADHLIAQGNRAETEGDFREACEHYRKAVEAAPGYAKAQLNLGIGLEGVGDVGGALAAYEAALAIDSTNPYASYNMGKLLYVGGALDRAERLLQSALAQRPEFPEAQVALSSVYEALGKPDAAVAALEAAIRQRPDYVGALLNYGTLLSRTGRLADAEAALRRVIAIDGENADANYHLANLLHARGALDDAERLLRFALRYKPEFPEAYAALFHVYEAQARFDAATSALEIALKQRPDWAGAWHNYGAVLRKQQRLPEAEAALRRAIEIAPGMSVAYQALGAVLFNQSRIAEALEVFRTGRSHDAGRFELESAELFTLNFCDDVSRDEFFAKHKAFGARLERAHSSRFEPFQNVRDPERHLRIGYVSGDFSHHPVTFFLLPLLERHDRTTYQIYCYSVGTKGDDITRRAEGAADVWREMASVSDIRLADTINQDQIDILVDLSGHSGESRLSTFAQQPAPVQITWLGYPNTTGLTRIHYRLCDRYTDPPGQTDHIHTESLLRLTHSQWCYRPPVSVEAPRQPACRRNGYVTFGSFNQVTKLSRSTRRIWAEILTRLPTSRLALAGVPEGHARAALLRDLGGERVAGRVAFLPRVTLDEYFRRFNTVDIALDPTPYSGCTTTFDTLWMGVPVITVPGEMPASRTTASILSALGLDEWIASTPEDYVRLAVERARDEALRTEFLESMRERMRGSALMDEVGFARDMEEAYRRAWRSWCNGQK